MTDFKEYFKFPLRMWENFSIKVFTSDNKMAFDWLIDIPVESKQKLLDRINGIDSTPYKVTKEYWHHNGIIYCKLLSGQHAGKEFKLCRIRGWGMLTGVGGYALDSREASFIQDNFAEYCVKMLNGDKK